MFCMISVYQKGQEVNKNLAYDGLWSQTDIAVDGCVSQVYTMFQYGCVMSLEFSSTFFPISEEHCKKQNGEGIRKES